MPIIAGQITGSALTASVNYTFLANIPAGIVSGAAQVAPLLPTGTVSSSGQVDYNSITNKLSGVVSSSAQTPIRTFTVTNAGPSAYVIDGVNNPTLTLIRGFTYNFNQILAGHPFWIQTVAGAYSSGNIYSSGITNNGVEVGILTFTVPYDAPNTLYYVCQYHSSMAGVINIKDIQPSGLVSSSAQYPGWVTSSAQIDYNSIQNKLSGVVSSSVQVQPLLPGGTVSSSVQYPGWVTASSQIDYNSIQNKLSGVVSSSTQIVPLLPEGTISASSQVALNAISGVTFSNSSFYFPNNLRVEGTITAQEINTEYVSSSIIYESGSTKFGDSADDVMSVTGSIRVLAGTISGSMVGMFSSSAQVDYNSIQNKLSGVVSSSAQVQPLLPNGTVSSSAQYPGWVTASSQIDYNSIQNKLSGVISSSTQFNALVGTSASFAITASAANSITFVPQTASYANTSSFATTASAADSITFIPQSASFADISISSSFASIAETASAATSITFTPATASYSITSSYAETTAPINTIFETVYTGENITKGDPLYISGSQGSHPIVYKADAGNANKMPVVAIANETIASGNTTSAIVLGLISGIDLTGYSAGTEIYVAVGGGWTATRPTGSAIVQVLGIVTKGGNGGKGLVLNPGPVNLPNLNSGSVWVGNGSSIPTALPTSSIQNVISSSFATTASAATSITFIPLTASFATTSSFANNAQSSSFATTASAATSITFTPPTASFATTASYALNAGAGAGFPFSGSAVITGSLELIDTANKGGITGSLLGTASNAVNATNAVTASYAINADTAIGINVDNHSFVGNGVTTNYTLSQSYAIISLNVSVDGLTLTPVVDYSIAGTTLSLVSAPPSESNVFVKAWSNATQNVNGSFTGSFIGTLNGDMTGSAKFNTLPNISIRGDTHLFIGNGVTTAYTLSSSYDDSVVFVSIDGMTQALIEDFSVSGTTLNLVIAPPSASNVLVKAVRLVIS